MSTYQPRGLAPSEHLWWWQVTWAAAELVAWLGAVAVGVWASGVAGPAQFCGVASLQGLDVIRDPATSPLLQKGLVNLCRMPGPERSPEFTLQHLARP